MTVEISHILSWRGIFSQAWIFSCWFSLPIWLTSSGRSEAEGRGNNKAGLLVGRLGGRNHSSFLLCLCIWEHFAVCCLHRHGGNFSKAPGWVPRTLGHGCAEKVDLLIMVSEAWLPSSHDYLFCIREDFRGNLPGSLLPHILALCK